MAKTGLKKKEPTWQTSTKKKKKKKNHPSLLNLWFSVTEAAQRGLLPDPQGGQLHLDQELHADRRREAEGKRDADTNMRIIRTNSQKIAKNRKKWFLFYKQVFFFCTFALHSVFTNMDTCIFFFQILLPPIPQTCLQTSMALGILLRPWQEEEPPGGRAGLPAAGGRGHRAAAAPRRRRARRARRAQRLHRLLRAGAPPAQPPRLRLPLQVRGARAHRVERGKGGGGEEAQTPMEAHTHTPTSVARIAKCQNFLDK